ncbi:MAG: TM0996/MTH895 family glutaredoxin-like protein [Flavobacteriaceae bacterium]|nr:TM0996/MTH895 family glutaredoxin-like protein [Flavobacteriaceae bacterium]
MKTIKVLGSGCSNCRTTELLIKEVANEQNIDVEIIKIDDIEKIMEYDVMNTPAVVINEKVVIKGRVPSVDEIKSFIGSNGDDCCNEVTDSCCTPTKDNETSTSCCS